MPGPATPRVAMYQRWRRLLFLHWEVDPEAMARLLPDSLRPDTRDGKAYVGLVPFAMEGIRAAGWPALPGTSAFLELNVRSYVRPRQGDGPSGVWFHSLDAANWLAVRVARLSFGLPYHLARMRMVVAPDESTHYQSTRSRGHARCELSYRPGPSTGPAVAGTLDHFLIERYVLYAMRRGRLIRGRVRHAPYQLRSAQLGTLGEDMIAAAGIARPGAGPLIHYADGVDVQIPLPTPAEAPDVEAERER